jgi:LCP family protein required for cell wall assembly
MHPDSLYGKGTSPEASGGALAAEAVENFLDVRIDYIAQVDFRGFERLVDMIDGIKVDVQKPILDAEYPTENFGFERIYIPAGLQILDGYTALRYARSRHSGTDFERSRRQQQVLRAFLEEFQRRGLLDQIDMLSQMVENLQQSVNTTMPIGDLQVIRGLADFAQNINPDDIVQLSINPNDVGVVLEDGSDIYWNEQDIATLVKKLEAGPEAIEEEASLQVQNGTNRAGLASRVTSFLENEGFEMMPADDAPELYNRTMIIDYSGQFPNTRQQLADLLLVADRYVYATPPAEAPPQPLNVDIVVIVGQDYRE